MYKKESYKRMSEPNILRKCADNLYLHNPKLIDNFIDEIIDEFERALNTSLFKLHVIAYIESIKTMTSLEKQMFTLLFLCDKIYQIFANNNEYDYLRDIVLRNDRIVANKIYEYINFTEYPSELTKEYISMDNISWDYLDKICLSYNKIDNGILQKMLENKNCIGFFVSEIQNSDCISLYKLDEIGKKIKIHRSQYIASDTENMFIHKHSGSKKSFEDILDTATNSFLINLIPAKEVHNIICEYENYIRNTKRKKVIGKLKRIINK